MPAWAGDPFATPSARAEAAILAQMMGGSPAASPPPGSMLLMRSATPVLPVAGPRAPMPAFVAAAARHELEPVAEAAAQAHGVGVDFFKRLIRQESGFNAGAVSRAGAQGVAQFMPGTAAQVGLDDPFDPHKALPKSAELLATLQQRLGNEGLAAAAYNAGEGRVRAWLAGRSGLPRETQLYVRAITGREAQDWLLPELAQKLRAAPMLVQMGTLGPLARLQATSPEWQAGSRLWSAQPQLASLIETAGLAANRRRAAGAAGKGGGTAKAWGERALCESLRGSGCIVAAVY